MNPEKKSHTEKIRRFGSLAYIRIPTSESKFSEKAVKAMLMKPERDVEFTVNQESENNIINILETSIPKRGRPPKGKNVQSKIEPKN